MAQADRYAVSLGYGTNLCHSLTAISKKNLADANPDPLVSLCHHSHPTLVQRHEAIKAALGAKQKKEKGS